MAQDLRRENGNVVAGVGLAGDMKVLLSVLGELLEEEGEQGVDVLACSDGVGDAVAGVREADVDGLVEEDDVRVGVPAVFVVGEVAPFVCDAAWAEFE